VTRRLLSWDGCLNVRDLGGHRLAAGGATRYRRVVRADCVRQLTDDGWHALVGYGIRTVVDLRQPSERAEDPPRDVPVGVVHTPFVRDREQAEWEELHAIGAAAGDDYVAATREVYLALLESSGAEVAAALTAVATAPEGGVLVHCHAGKDRTGLLTALLLDLAGAERSSIAEDYALSGTLLARTLSDWVDEAPDERERGRRTRLSATPAAAMLDVLAELDARHGGARRFLLEAGATGADLDRAAARLLD
jgi:protein tyrosine/serine phosphatase